MWARSAVRRLAGVAESYVVVVDQFRVVWISYRRVHIGLADHPLTSIHPCIINYHVVFISEISSVYSDEQPRPIPSAESPASRLPAARCHRQFVGCNYSECHVALWQWEQRS